MVQAAVRIIGDVSGPAGDTDGRRGAIGTGFLLSVPSERLPDLRHTYALTAHHVINRQPDVEIQIPDPFANGALYEPLAVAGWRQPLSGLDLALSPLLHYPDRTYRTLELENLIPDNPPSPLLDLGMPIHSVGILDPLDRPVVRTGNLGSAGSSRWGPTRRAV